MDDRAHAVAGLRTIGRMLLRAGEVEGFSLCGPWSYKAEGRAGLRAFRRKQVRAACTLGEKRCGPLLLRRTRVRAVEKLGGSPCGPWIFRA